MQAWRILKRWHFRKGRRLALMDAGIRPRRQGPARRMPRCLVVATTIAIGGCGLVEIDNDTSLVDIQPQVRLDLPTDGLEVATVELSGLPAPTLDALRAADWDAAAWISVLPVTIQTEDAPDDIPAVLGNYTVGNDDVVRFTPMFPFDAGQRYTVRFNPSALPEPTAGAGKPLTSTLEVPRPDVDPSTVVTRLFPTSAQLPENQLKLYVEFSAPMSAVDGLDYVRLIDDAGREVEAPFLPLGENFWDYDYKRYTIFFDPGRVKTGILTNEELGRPLRVGAAYTLEIDAAWPDAEGLPLEKPFRKEFTVGSFNGTPLDTAKWHLRIPGTGTTSRLVVSFPEPLDHALLVRGLGVEDENRQQVDGAIEITSWETRWSFTPRQPWVAGTYSLVALSILEDLAGNRIGTPFEIDRFDQIDRSDEQEYYRVPFEIGP